jgi:PAS domain-containing protein
MKQDDVKRTEPLAVHHSWPIFEQDRHFDLGSVLSSAVTDIVEPEQVGALGVHHAGLWECDLSDSSLTWSGGVFDIFGLPRGSSVTRDEALAFYREESRAAMERLRAYAIKHQRGFTLDVEIDPATGGRRWMRLIGAPVCKAGRAVRLHGLKLII